MAGLSDDPESAIESQNSPFEFSDFPQTLVTEKIIFCIDVLIFSSEDETIIKSIDNLLKSYFTVKNKISDKPAEFECFLIGNSDTIIHSCINSAKDLHAAILNISKLECEEEKEPLEIDKVFNRIAEIVEIPDPNCNQKNLPPPYVYHVVWFFGRNLYVPTIEDTNSFDFLMMTPYVALDILYMYDSNLENNKCEEISQSLVGLNENGQGYYLNVSISNKIKMVSCLSQLLGHPLMRPSQWKAKFNILEMGPQVEDIIKDTEH